MTESVARSNLTSGAKVFLVVAVVLGAVNLVDFIFYGQQLYDLAAAVGFALMAYGTYKNGNRSRPSSDNDPTFDKRAQYAMVAGVLLALGVIAARYLL